MTILEVNQTWAEETVRQEGDGRVDLVLGYQFICDTPITSTLQLLTDSRFPQLGQSHPENSDLFAVARQIKRIEKSRHVGEGEITFSTRLDSNTKDPESNNQGLNDDPLADFPVVEWNPIEGTKVAVVGRLRDPETGDFSNAYTPITNSANRPYFDPPVEIRASEWQVLYRRNESAANPELLGYLNVVNKDAFTIDGIPIGIGQAFMPGARIGPRSYRNKRFFRPVTYDIRLLPAYTRTGEVVGFRGWETELQDRGYEYIDGSGDLVRATNDDGTDASEPIFLDGSGGKAATPSESPSRVYLCYIEKQFGPFNLT